MQTLVMQDTGGTRATVAAGIAAVQAMLPIANDVKRVPVPASHLNFEKSLGSAMKAGTTPLQEVYHYAEPIDKAGFVFMDSPSYDPVASTGQIASGANLICFTTERGSMFGSKPAPTIKLASNSPMYQRLEEDMDINCGLILDGELSVQAMGQQIFEQILRHASGEPTKSEALGLGDHEFVPWHLGVVS